MRTLAMVVVCGTTGVGRGCSALSAQHSALSSSFEVLGTAKGTATSVHLIDLITENKLG